LDCTSFSLSLSLSLSFFVSTQRSLFVLTQHNTHTHTHRVVVILVFFVDSESSLDRFAKYSFFELGKDSIVGLVVSMVLSVAYRKDSYMSNSILGDTSQAPTIIPYPTLMAYIWMPLEYIEVIAEILFSVLWLVNLYKGDVYTIPEGSEVDTILMSWVFGMLDLWLFRVPDLTERAMQFIGGGDSDSNKNVTTKKSEVSPGTITGTTTVGDSTTTDTSFKSTLPSVLLLVFYASAAVITSVLFLFYYYDRLDTCTQGDDGITGFVSEYDKANCAWCEDENGWCSY